MSHFVRCALVASLFLLGCSPKPTATCADTCSGCCDSAGTCQAGNSTQACGASGFTCQSCPVNNSCEFGTCVPTSQAGGGGGTTTGGGGGTTGGGTGGSGGGAMGGGTGGSGGGAMGGGSGGGGGAMGGGMGGGGGGGGSSPDAGICAGTLSQCGTECLDLGSSLENCGSCGNVCGNGEVCINARCQLLPDDCTVAQAQCGSGYFCDPVTHKCAVGCRLSTDCPQGGTCSSGVCSCPSAQHACGNTCVSNAAPTSCGTSCMACSAPAHGTATCSTGTCGFTCDTGFVQQGSTCADVNECASNNGGCSANATCTNTMGSRTCACNAGYMGDGLTCSLINLCATNNGGCLSNATCASMNGTSRTCTCPNGYTGDGITACNDINECSSNNGGCSVNATCANIPGSRTCTCNSGYSGNGITCTAGNPCSPNNGGCQAVAICTPTSPTTRTCACPSGYTGDGITACNDINECSSNNGGCSANATCMNIPGSRTCTCNSGYTGDGVVCTMGSRTIAIVQVGSGIAGTLTSAANETFIVIRDAATGAFISQTALPTAAAGGNYPITLSGTATTEGMLNVSADNQSLVLAGYAVTPGTTQVATTLGIPRVVARVTISNSAIDTRTLITDAYQGANIRSAASANGTGYWLGGTYNVPDAGGVAGVRYVVQGSTGATADVFSQVTNIRATEIIGGQLFASTGTNPNTDGGTELSRVFGIGTGLPTSTAPVSVNFPGLPTVGTPSNFVLLDRSTIINGPDTLYVGETSGSIAARRYDFNGATWVEGATFPLVSGSAAFIAVLVDSSTQVTILATGTPGLVRWTDNGVMGLGAQGTVVIANTPGTSLRGIVVMP